jgi:hypothetical protein
MLAVGEAAATFQLAWLACSPMRCHIGRARSELFRRALNGKWTVEQESSWLHPRFFLISSSLSLMRFSMPRSVGSYQRLPASDGGRQVISVRASSK